MIETQTIDVTKKVSRYIKFGLIGLLLAAAAIAGVVFYYQHVEDVMTIDNAKVAGTLVSVRVLADGNISELTRADGDQVQAGDVIAKLEVSITEEQLAQLEQSVQMAKDSYAELEQGQWVKVEVRTPKTKTVVIPQPTQQIVREAPPVDLYALEERKNRMEKLYEMGAISRVQRDAAVAEYENARYEASQPIIEEYEPEPLVQTETEYEIEYVDQFQPTPPEILEGARMAIKQAEMSLNTARQEAQQTEVTAPVSGTIYYSVEPNEAITAGMPIAKVGDSNELWLEAEVTEDQFYRLSLGKLVSYVLGGKTLSGTVIEKIAPYEYNYGGPYPLLLAENDPAEPIDSPDQIVSSESVAPNEPIDPNEKNDPIDQTDQSNQIENPNYEVVDAPFDSSGLQNNSEYEPEPAPKFVARFSMPPDFEIRPNTMTSVKVYDPLISWNWIKPMYWDLRERSRELLSRLRGQH